MKLKKTFITGIILVLLNCSGCTALIYYIDGIANYQPTTPRDTAKEIGKLLGRYGHIAFKDK